MYKNLIQDSVSQILDCDKLATNSVELLYATATASAVQFVRSAALPSFNSLKR